MRGAILPLPNTPSWRGAWLSTGTSSPYLLLRRIQFVSVYPPVIFVSLIDFALKVTWKWKHFFSPQMHYVMRS
jgi:hypothetical protein